MSGSGVILSKIKVRVKKDFPFVGLKMSIKIHPVYKTLFETRSCMKHVWAPWRIKFIQRTEREQGCIFCNALAKPDGIDNLIIYRGERIFVILNRYPYTSGHVMVVPMQHFASYSDLDRETRADLMEGINTATKVIAKVYCADGFNVGANLGLAAGAGVTGHVHFHVVPRWGGDANYMSTVGGVRVIPEALEVTYQRLKENWQAE
jgi:ATP adenylyltransferase